MTEEINKQIKLLKKYGVNDYVIENGRIVINGSPWLNSLTTAPENFLSKTTINEGLWLNSLTTVPENFLEGATISGGLSLDSLTTVSGNFLFKTTINGSLWLDSLTTVPENFLSNTIVEGWVTRKNVHKYGFLSRNKNTDKIAQFVKDNVLEGEEIEINYQ